ncbi:MAG: hypothetical protein WCZ19_04845 [Acholeplasma sp.]
MAKKYRAVESKIHWLTWVSIAAIVTVMVVLLIALQPSPKNVFYDSYKAVATDINFEKKLPRDNKFILINRLEDGFLGFNKGLYSAGNKSDEVAIVYFGAPSLENGSANIANVYARLYGASTMDPVIEPSDLYTSLEDQVNLYYFEHSGEDFANLVKSLNEKYEDANIIAQTVPFILVLLNNEVVDFAVLNESNIPLQLLNFYNDVLANDAVAELLD